MSARIERLLLVLTPLAAMATVALGLRVGAGSAVRAAVVYGAPVSGAGTGLAWQLVAFDEEHGYREPVALPDVEVVARQGAREVHWRGATNADGAMEMLLPLAEPAEYLEVRAGRALLAQGSTTVPPSLPRDPPASSWASFSRREGDVVLDVAVLGQRVATGFPASLWVRATDGASHAPLRGRRHRAGARFELRAGVSPDDDRRARLGADRRDAGRTRGRRRAPRPGERWTHRAVGRRALRLAGCGAARHGTSASRPRRSP